MLEKDTITITTQYLNQNTQFLEGTPSKYIIFKKKPGLGATYGEIEHKGRNSIILEPNTPVLEGKKNAVNASGERLHPDILVVFKGIEKADVIRYLESEIKPKKILCTPEAYMSKVKPAILDSEFNLYKDFFMLVDECDRIIKDVIYRKNIVMPMTDFFKFNKSTLISATAIEPSDPRFLANGFKILDLIPSEATRQNLDLIHTNNILYALRDTLAKNEGKTIFIFINSPNLAYVLIKRLEIESKSKIYCSSKGVRSLKGKFDNTKSKLGDYARINFLTSRYYSAVDIILEEKPCIIMITDVLRRTFTMLDPYTDVIQIIGRFRNGVMNATHITNISDEMDWKNPAEAIQFLHDSFKCYQKIRSIAFSNNGTAGGLLTGEQALTGTDIHTYVDEETAELNSFMVDNFSLEQKTIHNYTHIDVLKEAYSNTEYFKIKFCSMWYDVNDSLMLLLEKESRSQETNKVIANLLQNYTLNRTVAFLNNPYEVISTEGDTIKTLEKEYAELFDIFNTIEFSKMEELDFDIRKMSKESEKIKRLNESQNEEMIKEIHLLYSEGEKIPRSKIKVDLQFIYSKYHIKKKATAAQIVEYYEAELLNTKPKTWLIGRVKIGME